MNEIRIPYKPNKVIFVFAVLFSAICTGIMGNVAVNNDRGLILNHIIELSPQGATSFYWIITIGALALALVSLFGLVKSIFSKREIVITETSITLPKSSFSKLDIKVRFSDITGINMQTIQKTKILNIEHLGGKLSIPSSMLPNKSSFEDLVSQLLTKVNG